MAYWRRGSRRPCCQPRSEILAVFRHTRKTFTAVTTGYLFLATARRIMGDTTWSEI